MQQELKGIRRTYNRLGLAMLSFMAIYQLLSIPVIVVIAKLGLQRLLQSSWFHVLVNESIQCLVAMPVAALIMRSAHTQTVPLPRRKLPLWQLGRYLLLSLGLLFLFNLVGTGINELISLAKGSAAGNIVEQSISSYTLAQNILLTVILAPLVEELLFRRMIYRCVGCYGTRVYIITSACLFMLMHGNVVQYPYAFAVGAMFAWVYLRTGSLATTILLHALVNFVGGIVPVLGQHFEPLLLAQALLYFFCAVYTAATAWQTLLRSHLLDGRPLPPAQLPEGGLDAALLNPGMMLFTLASLLMAGYVILYV